MTITEGNTMKKIISINNDYYNQNAKDFIENTKDIDMSEFYLEFLPMIPNAGRILDIGCGSGRDSLYFQNRGFEVYAIDSSEEMIHYVSSFLGEKAQMKDVMEINEDNFYDGIWACASLLHLKKDEISKVFEKISRAMKNDSVFYLSFKHGDFEGIRNGRYFTDLNLAAFTELIRDIPHLKIVKTWISQDKRPERNEEWLNIVLRKRLNN